MSAGGLPAASGAVNFSGGRPLITPRPRNGGNRMNGIIYLVGLVVVVIAVLSFFGLR